MFRCRENSYFSHRGFRYLQVKARKQKWKSERNGTREVMIAYLKDFQDVCRKYGVKLNTHIGKDMMHCWGAMEFVPEARAVRQEYFKALQ